MQSCTPGLNSISFLGFHSFQGKGCPGGFWGTNISQVSLLQVLDRWDSSGFRKGFEQATDPCSFLSHHLLLRSLLVANFSALPVLFKEGLKNREAVEGTTATLHCEMTKAGAEVKWRKGAQTLKPSNKYRMKQEGAEAELLVRDLQVEDTGDYTCVCGDQKTTAVLTVHGNQMLPLHS